MDVIDAWSTLMMMISLLSKKQWVKLQDTSFNNTGLPAILNCIRAEIDAILVNAAVYKKYDKNEKGLLAISMPGWKILCNLLPSKSHDSNKCRQNIFFTNGLYPNH